MSTIASLESTFLTAADVPPNLKGLHEGDFVRWGNDATPRVVTRVGYRKTATDYRDDATRALATVEGRLAMNGLRAMAGGPVRTKDVVFAIARAMCARDHCGGPERGLVVEPRDDRRVMRVAGTRIVHIGDYYPPRGSGEDYEDGGLNNRRAIVLVRTGRGEVISGDLVRAEPFLRDAFLHDAQVESIP